MGAILILAAVTSATLASPASAARPRALLISSYHPGFPTFFQQVRGIRPVLEEHGIDLDIEFMDSKRFGDRASIDVFADLLGRKLARLPRYDILIAADDNALKLVLDRRADLFPDLPVVFLGINDRDLAARAASLPRVTGVVEAVSMVETMRLMVALRPRARRLVALVDGTPSGQGDLETFLALAYAFPHHELVTLSLTESTFSELGERLRALDETSAVLLLSAYVDREGRRMRFDESLELILAHLDQPLFHLWHHGIGDGLLGGVVVSHEAQGDAAADLVVEHLLRHEVHSTPHSSPNPTVIDRAVFDRFALDDARLPDDVVIVNGTDSPWDRYLWPILGVLLFVTLQALIIVVLVRNNARLRRAKEALRESEQRYFSLFALNGSAMLLLDPIAGRIVDANESACTFYGYPLGDLTRLALSDLSTTPETELTSRLDGLAQGQVHHLVARHRLADGQTRDIELYGGPIVLGGRALIYVTIHDISRRRRAEEERERLSERLRHAEKMEAIGTLAGGIAHDFNNILMIILGNAQLISLYADDPDERASLRESVETIEEVSRRGADLVRQILAFSRQADVELEEVDPHPIVRESLTLLRRTLPATIELVERLEEDAGPVRADPTQLGQIVMNLGANALHAMEETGGRLSVVLSGVDLDAARLASVPKQAPGRYVCLSVSDTGPGVPEAIREHIFTPFFTTKEVGKGTGMGLAIIHGIVTGAGGFIELETAPGEGARFLVYLPVAGRQARGTAEAGGPVATQRA